MMSENVDLILTGTLPAELTSGLIERTGWVLFHSLWQFALLALILACLERLFFQRSANVKYVAASLALSGMAVCAAITFLFWSPESVRLESIRNPENTLGSGLAADVPPAGRGNRAESSVAASATVSRATDSGGDETPTALTGSSHGEAWPPSTQAANVDVLPVVSIRERAVRGLSRYASTAAFFWLFGLSLASLRPVLAGLRIRRLRTHGLTPVSADIQALLVRVAAGLQLRCAVQILHSSQISVPVVIGWLRPLVLIPASAATGLTPQQLEAVIAHELAHVQRLDCLLNLLQVLIETVFYYHPAVWWVSRRIRIHREDCCDDRAVRFVRSPLAYASALLTLCEMQQPGAGIPVTAIPATGGTLKKRIHRVLGLPASSPSPAGWWWSTSLVAVLLVVASLSTVAHLDSPADENAQVTAGDDFPAAETQQLPLHPPARLESERRALLEQLESLGVRVNTSFDIRMPPVGEPTPIPLRATLFDPPEAAWPLLGQLHLLSELHLTASQVSTTAFHHVQGMTRLNTIHVVNSRFDSSHLAELAPLANLQHIDVMLDVFQQTDHERQLLLGEMTPEEQQRFDAIRGHDRKGRHIAQASILTDRALLQLSGLTRLQTLKLINTFVTNKGIQSLRNMQGLRKVEMNCAEPLNRESMAYFGTLPELTDLNLGGEVDAEVAAGLSLSKTLRNLDLRSVDHATASALAEIPTLERLTLWSSRLSDQSLIELAKLKQLKRLDIRFADQALLTMDGIRQFQNLRPGCEVLHDLKSKSLSEKTRVLPADHFLVCVHGKYVSVRGEIENDLKPHLASLQSAAEFRPLPREGFVGGIVLVNGQIDRDKLVNSLSASDGYTVVYAEPLTMTRLTTEGVMFEKLIPKNSGDAANDRSAVATPPDTNHPAPTRRSQAPSSDTESTPEEFPAFPDLIVQLRSAGHESTANALEADYARLKVSVQRHPNGVICYGRIVSQKHRGTVLTEAA
ncbi:MAG: M48 family metalloprotease [Planctomycetaceae bacterium]|nr:M48 family metalloprotease [Planctomycetaceae bacterium]